MSRYIDIENLSIEKINRNILDFPEEAEGWNNCLDAIKMEPTADVQEVKHGKWIKNKPNPKAMKAFHKLGLGKSMGANSIYWTCSECGTWGTPVYKFCTECGAKMDKEFENE